MKKNVASLLLLVMLLGSFASYATPERGQLNTELDAFIEQNRSRVPGAALSLFTADETIYERIIGFENKEDTIAMSEDSVIDWGSITKLLTWVSLMQLAEEGKLALEEDIRTHLPPELMTNFRYDQAVTFLDLMNHRAGFQESLVNLFVPFGKNVPPLEEALGTHPPAQVFPPGTVVAYSNWSTALGGYLVETISGMDFADYVHAKIFEPLGMKHTAIRPDLSDQPWVLSRRRNLRGYSSNGEYLPDGFMSIPLYPAGMAVGTLGDFRLFAQALLSADENPTLFQKAETKEKFFSPSAWYENGVPRNSHGMWHYSFSSPVVGHGGNTAACSSQLLLDRKSGLGMVIMTNQQGETVFNNELPTVVFGDFTGSPYYDSLRPIPTSFVTTARSVFRGPLKFLSIALQKMEESDRETLWSYSDSDSIARIQMPYTDLLELTGFSLWIRLAAIFFLIGGALYGVLTLVLGGVMLRLIRKFRYKKRKMTPICRPWRRWNYLASAAMMLLFINLGILLFQLLLFQPISHYYWQLIVSALLLLAIAGLTVSFFFLKKVPETRLERAKTLLTYFLLAGVLFTGIYFELFRFWAL